MSDDTLPSGGDAPAGAAAAVPTTAQFEREARAFLDANAERRPEETFVWGQGSDDVSLLPERTPEQDARRPRRRHGPGPATVFDAGFGWITGPARYGGRGLPAEYRRIYRLGRRRSTGRRRCRSTASASAWWPRRSWPTPPTG